MASLIYDKAKEEFLSGALDLTTAVLRAVLIDTGTYTVSAAHEDYVDLSGVVGTESDIFDAKTVTGGIFNAGDRTFTAVSGVSAEALVIFVDTGTPSSDRLVVFLDEADVTGLPLTPSGGDVTVIWNATGIFKL